MMPEICYTMLIKLLGNFKINIRRKMKLIFSSSHRDTSMFNCGLLSFNYVNSLIGAFAKSIESIGRQAKHCNKAQCGKKQNRFTFLIVQSM